MVYESTKYVFLMNNNTKVKYCLFVSERIKPGGEAMWLLVNSLILQLVRDPVQL